VSRPTRGLLCAAGLAAIGVGGWEDAQLARDIVYQAQGKCDYLNCTNSWTLPSLAAALVVVAAGAVLFAWAVYPRKRNPSTAALKADRNSN
jgi:hypothetical protein